jgi:hypothetical protein
MKIPWLLLPVLLAGCASVSRQTTANPPTAVTEIGTDLYRIDLAQPNGRDPSRAEDFALLRASQLAIEKGFSHFAIVDIGRASTPAPLRTFASSRNTESDYGIYGASGHTFDMLQMTAATRQITVQCLNKPPPEMLASNARNIEKSVREKYGMQ